MGDKTTWRRMIRIKFRALQKATRSAVPGSLSVAYLLPHALAGLKVLTLWSALRIMVDKMLERFGRSGAGGTIRAEMGAIQRRGGIPGLAPTAFESDSNNLGVGYAMGAKRTAQLYRTELRRNEPLARVLGNLLNVPYFFAGLLYRVFSSSAVYARDLFMGKRRSRRDRFTGGRPSVTLEDKELSNMIDGNVDVFWGTQTSNGRVAIGATPRATRHGIVRYYQQMLMIRLLLMDPRSTGLPFESYKQNNIENLERQLLALSREGPVIRHQGKLIDPGKTMQNSALEATWVNLNGGKLEFTANPILLREKKLWLPRAFMQGKVVDQEAEAATLLWDAYQRKADQKDSTMKRDYCFLSFQDFLKTTEEVLLSLAVEGLGGTYMAQLGRRLVHKSRLDPDWEKISLSAEALQDDGILRFNTRWFKHEESAVSGHRRSYSDRTFFDRVDQWYSNYFTAIEFDYTKHRSSRTHPSGSLLYQAIYTAIRAATHFSGSDITDKMVEGYTKQMLDTPSLGRPDLFLSILARSLSQDAWYGEPHAPQALVLPLLHKKLGNVDKAVAYLWKWNIILAAAEVMRNAENPVEAYLEAGHLVNRVSLLGSRSSKLWGNIDPVLISVDNHVESMGLVMHKGGKNTDQNKLVLTALLGEYASTAKTKSTRRERLGTRARTFAKQNGLAVHFNALVASAKDRRLQLKKIKRFDHKPQLSFLGQPITLFAPVLELSQEDSDMDESDVKSEESTSNSSMTTQPEYRPTRRARRVSTPAPVLSTALRSLSVDVGHKAHHVRIAAHDTSHLYTPDTPHTANFPVLESYQSSDDNDHGMDDAGMALSKAPDGGSGL